LSHLTRVVRRGWVHGGAWLLRLGPRGRGERFVLGAIEPPRREPAVAHLGHLPDDSVDADPAAGAGPVAAVPAAAADPCDAASEHDAAAHWARYILLRLPVGEHGEDVVPPGADTL